MGGGWLAAPSQEPHPRFRPSGLVFTGLRSNPLQSWQPYTNDRFQNAGLYEVRIFSVLENGENGLRDEGADGGNASRISGLEPPLPLGQTNGYWLNCLTVQTQLTYDYLFASIVCSVCNVNSGVECRQTTRLLEHTLLVILVYRPSAGGQEDAQHSDTHDESVQPHGQRSRTNLR